jgi:hypothetical protein
VGVEYGKFSLGLAGGERVWPASTWLAANIPGYTGYTVDTAIYQSRYLSNSGRLFFNSADALVPKDVNSQWDVYEYEPEGVGAQSGHPCSPAAASGSSTYRPARTYNIEGRPGEEGPGCTSLISSGTSSGESAFLDASESGGDVFFLTTSRLLPQDVDSSLDVYDAHECTSESPCLPPAAEALPPCTTEASCKAAPSPQPQIFGAGPSETFTGPGDLTPAPPVVPKKVTKKTVKCKKGLVKTKKARCVKRSKPKKRAKKSSNGRGARR